MSLLILASCVRDAAVPDRAADVERRRRRAAPRRPSVVTTTSLAPDQPFRQLASARPSRRRPAAPRSVIRTRVRPSSRVDERVVRLRDLAQHRQPIAVGQQAHQIADRRRHAERADHPADDLAARAARRWRDSARRRAAAARRRRRRHGASSSPGCASSVPASRASSSSARAYRLARLPVTARASPISTNSRTKRVWSSGVTRRRARAPSPGGSPPRRSRCAPPRRADCDFLLGDQPWRPRGCARPPRVPARGGAARASSAVASRSAFRRSCTPGSSARSRVELRAQLARPRCRARLPAASPSRRRSVRSRKYSRIGPARKRTST